MLRPGQKVKISPIAMHSDTGDVPNIAGQITTIVSYAELESMAHNKECYYTEAHELAMAREILWPIDDEPCEDEFLEKFKDIIKETVV